MNGIWFKYGQQPSGFIKHWKTVVDRVRSVNPDRSQYAFIWAPNSGNGYPYKNPKDVKLKSNSTDFLLMDTNKDGIISLADDPYSPFYPGKCCQVNEFLGDDYVDWVGFSIYDYGPRWPWVHNAVPSPGKVEDILTGRNGWGTYNFYAMFCSENGSLKSKGGKPFMITETSSTTHLWVSPNSEPYNSLVPIRPVIYKFNHY